MKTTIKIRVTAEIEVSDELLDRINDEEELRDFATRNCFKNNSRRIKKVEVKLPVEDNPLRPIIEI